MQKGAGSAVPLITDADVWRASETVPPTSRGTRTLQTHPPRTVEMVPVPPRESGSAIGTEICIASNGKFERAPEPKPLARAWSVEPRTSTTPAPAVNPTRRVKRPTPSGMGVTRPTPASTFVAVPTPPRGQAALVLTKPRAQTSPSPEQQLAAAVETQVKASREVLARLDKPEVEGFRRKLGELSKRVQELKPNSQDELLAKIFILGSRVSIHFYNKQLDLIQRGQLQIEGRFTVLNNIMNAANDLRKRSHRQIQERVLPEELQGQLLLQGTLAEGLADAASQKLQALINPTTAAQPPRRPTPPAKSPLSRGR